MLTCLLLAIIAFAFNCNYVLVKVFSPWLCFYDSCTLSIVVASAHVFYLNFVEFSICHVNTN